MRRAFLCSCLALAGGSAPSALAGTSEAVTQVELRAGSERGLSAAPAREPFTLVGLHWRGSGKVAFRTRSITGRWSQWRPAAPEDDDGPDFGSAEHRRAAGWWIGSPWWVGPSDRVEVRRLGRVSRVRGYLVRSPAVSVPVRLLAATDTPAIVPRASWGADESIRRHAPSYASAVRFAIVHHTAGRNGYTRAEAAAIVRGIQLYHVQGNGWNDIGYNFLVDRFGTIYEGRFGGIDRNVVGAHAQGFNTGSTGIALLGTYGGSAPSRAAENALAALVAWRLDVAHVDPLGILTYLSGGSDRFPAKLPVLLRSVSGHRDTGFTECPGNAFYARLDDLGAAAARIGGPKIFEPRVDASAEGLVRFRARVSHALPWTVVVTAAGVEVASGEGTGSTVDWTWDASGVPSAAYTWTIAAGSARPAGGSVQAGFATPQLAIEDMSAKPTGITPNGDGQSDSASVSFSLTTAANVTVEIADATGIVVATVVDRVWTRSGEHTVEIDGADLVDGLYNVVVKARTLSSTEVVQAVPLTVSRTLGLVSVAPTLFSPNGDGRREHLDLGFALAAPATVTVRILRDDRWVATPLLGASLPAGSQKLRWDGRRSAGRLRDGAYTAVVEATDAVGTVSFAVPFASDTVAPRIHIVPGRRLRVAVSEPAVLKVWINGESLRREVRRPITVLIRWPEPIRRARVVAWDAAGNMSRPAIKVSASQ